MNKNVILFFLLLSIIALDCAADNGRGIKLITKDSHLRTALVIGNGEYKNSLLQNPPNDARAIANALKESGFVVSIEINASQRVMENAVRNFGKKLRKGGTGLFYYAGHGIQVNGRNYLVPVGATIESESDVKYEAVDAGLVLGKMEDAGNDLNIVILDACRNNPFARSFRSVEQGLARMDAPKGSLIAYATAPGSVAADGEDGNGIYTKYLIQNIHIQGLTIEQVLKRVRVAVANETSNKQIPWESSSLMGNFYFNTGEGDMNINIPAPITKVDAEEEMWGLVKDSNNISDIKSFLSAYPKGRFEKHAKLRLGQLNRTKKLPFTDKDELPEIKSTIDKYSNGMYYNPDSLKEILDRDFKYFWKGNLSYNYEGIIEYAETLNRRYNNAKIWWEYKNFTINGTRADVEATRYSEVYKIGSTRKKEHITPHIIKLNKINGSWRISEVQALYYIK